MNTEMALGFVTGVLLVAIVCTVIAKMAKKKGSVGRGEYDERQQIARGKAFTWAYATLLIYLAAWMVFRTMEIPFFMEGLSVILGALLSIAVFVGYSVFHDAYFKASESPRTWLSIISAVGLLNLGIGVGRLIRGETMAVRLYENMNLFVGVLFLIVLVCVVAKRAVDRREGD